MYCIFLHGPPASGKLTIGRKLSALLGIPMFHNHLTVDLALALFDFGTPGFVNVRERVWLTAFEESAAAMQSFVFTFTPEASVRPDLIGRLERAVKTRGGSLYFAAIHCSEAIVEQRIADASRAAFGKLRDVEVYRSIRETGAFQFPAMPTPLVTIDSALTSPDSAANTIQAALAAVERG
jgi:hypothetical protein